MKVNKSRSSAILISLLIILVLLGIFIFKKPAVTGKVIQGKETVYSENLNIQKNESGTYEWQVKNPGSIKAIKATGSVTSNGTAKVYIEKDGQKYLVFDSTKQLFDVNVHVLPEYKKILRGDEILIQIALVNLRGFGAGDVNVTYSIKDSSGNVIASEQEKIFVETQAKFVRKLVIPAEIKTGTYIANVEAFTNVVVGSGSDTFEVISKYGYRYPAELNYLIGMVVFVIIFVIMLVLSLHVYRRLKKKKEIAELKEKAPLKKIMRLKKELKALGEAYKLRFISKESYQKGKKRIEEKLGVSKK